MDPDLGMDMNGTMMPMYFSFGRDLTDFLFKGWTTHNITEFVMTCVAMVVLAVVAESLTFATSYLDQQRELHPLQYGRSESHPSARPYLTQPLLIPPSIQEFRRRKIRLHIAGTLVRVCHLVIGYLLMLAVMTYNASILIAIVLGCGVGYYIFGAVRQVYTSNMQTAFDHTESPELYESTTTSEREINDADLQQSAAPAPS